MEDQLASAGRVRCPIVLRYGAPKRNIASSAAVRTAMRGENAHINVYDGAGHSFDCRVSGSYNASAAALAHPRSWQALAEHRF